MSDQRNLNNEILISAQATQRDSPVDLSMTQDISVTMETDDAEPDWFQEIERDDEEDTGT